MEKKASVDRNLCTSCSICTCECPEIFDLKQDPSHAGDFKSFSNDRISHQPFAEKIENAIRNCPAHCIRWK